MRIIDLYHAKLAIMARDGSMQARRLFNQEVMLGQIYNPEILEFFRLSLKVDLYENDPETLRLYELTNKYETKEVLSYEIW